MAKKINDKIEELKAGVDWFYSDDFNLDEASERYKSLIKLAKEINLDLEGLKNEIATYKDKVVSFKIKKYEKPIRFFAIKEM